MISFEKIEAAAQVNSLLMKKYFSKILFPAAGFYEIFRNDYLPVLPSLRRTNSPT